VSLPAGATTIGLLGSATQSGATGATGTLTVNYTDGSTQQIPVGFSDWTLGAGSFKPLAGDTIAVTTPYRNIDDGTQDPTATYVYSVTWALQSGKTVASVTLPSPSGGYLGVFAPADVPGAGPSTGTRHRHPAPGGYGEARASNRPGFRAARPAYGATAAAGRGRPQPLFMDP